MAGKTRFLLFRDGRYYARRIVPKDLLKIVGKSKLRRPLGADKRVAFAGLSSALVLIEAELDHARRQLGQAAIHQSATRRASEVTLTAQELAQAHYQRQLALDEAMRNSDGPWAQIGINDIYVSSLRSAVAGRLSDREVDVLVGSFIDLFRLRGNTSASLGSSEWREAARFIAGAELEVLTRMAERDEGEFIPREAHPEHLRQPDVAEPAPDEFIEPVSLLGLLEVYLKGLEAENRGRATRRLWEPPFKDLVSFLRRHRGLSAKSNEPDDARSLTKSELMAWRDEKLETLAPRTVKDIYLAAIKAVLNRAVEDDKIPANPAIAVKVRVGSSSRSREKGYTTDEATAILELCLAYVPDVQTNPSNRESAHITAAKRWGPWLCALTGARVGEILQLRKADFRCEDGIYILRISPDAGTVKTRQFRDVPVHQQLVDIGFAELLRQSPEGPLFYAFDADPDGLPAQAVGARVAKWLQSSGLVPPGVAPNHGWRHRFKTIGIEVGVNGRVLDAIQGHAGRTAGDRYGDVTIRAKEKAIGQFPRYAIRPGVEPEASTS